MPAIVAPRATLPRGYPATPLVAPPDGARLSSMARHSLGEPAHRGPVGSGVRLTAEADLTLTSRLAQDAGVDGSARSLHRRANAAYIQMRDSHIRLLPGYERVDLTV